MIHLENDREILRPLAERLAAAVTSWQLGLKSMDYAMKKYVEPEKGVGEFWYFLADFTFEMYKAVQGEMAKKITKRETVQ